MTNEAYLIKSGCGMSSEASSHRPGRTGRALADLREVVAAARDSESLRAAAGVLVWSRLAILAVAVLAALWTGEGGLSATNAGAFDVPALTHPLGGLGDALLSPLARWDAVWYLQIADSGYGAANSPRVAFLPLYPLSVRGLGELLGGSPGARLLGSYAISLGALLGALALLWRLVSLELGRRFARPALLLVCVFPASLFLGAPYSESLFLLCSVGAFYAARTGRWAWAGIAIAAASGTRSAGVLLLLPVTLIYLYGPREDRPRPGLIGPGWIDSLRPVYAVRRDFAWLALGPAGLAAYALYLGLAHGDPLAFASAQDLWHREYAGPLAGVWEGLVAAVDGVRQIASGSRSRVFFEQAGGDPFRVAGMNLMLMATLVFAGVATAGVLRRLPFAYGAYVVAALALALSFPPDAQPLMSLPRFVLVLFPLFMWLALVCEERRVTDRVVAVSAMALGLFVVEFASWHFIA